MIEKNCSESIDIYYCFSLLTDFIGLIPNAIEFIGTIVNSFGGSFHASTVSRILTVLTSDIGCLQE